MTTIDHQHPKVVFEPVLGRWRVEYRTQWTDEWQTHRYHHTLEGACEVAQEMTNNDFDGVYRVVDTQPDAEDEHAPIVDHSCDDQARVSTFISPRFPDQIRNLWKGDPSEQSVRTALALAGNLIQELIDLRESIRGDK